MQIFFKSPSHSSSKRRNLSKGFTLVELLVSMGIIAVVTGIVLTKYMSFDSTVLLKGEAYEIALLLRESQVKSVSVAQIGSGNFEYPFGVSFTPNSNIYTAFYYADNIAPYPFYALNNAAVKISDFLLDRTMRIDELCVIVSSGPICRTGLNQGEQLDISFRRPEFKALFNAQGFGAISQSDIIGATIQVSSVAGGATKFIVEITKLGQISVYKK